MNKTLKSKNMNIIYDQRNTYTNEAMNQSIEYLRIPNRMKDPVSKTFYIK